MYHHRVELRRASASASTCASVVAAAGGGDEIKSMLYDNDATETTSTLQVLMEHHFIFFLFSINIAIYAPVDGFIEVVLVLIQQLSSFTHTSQASQTSLLPTAHWTLICWETRTFILEIMFYKKKKKIVSKN